MPIKSEQFKNYIKLYIYVKSYKIISFFFFTGNRHVFGTQLNISGGAFFQKRLIAKSCHLFLQKNCSIDFWLGSKNMALDNTVKKLPFKRYFPSYVKLFVSLLLSCIFCFVAQIRKMYYRKK